MKIYSLFIFLFLLVSCAHTAKRKPASGLDIITDEVENPRPQKWPSVLWYKILDATDEGLYTVTNALFDIIEDFDRQVYSAKKFKAGLRIKREVFDNQDVLHSYTVVDQFKLRLASKNVNFSVPLGLNNVSLGFRLGAGTDIDWVNIRQVTANKYATLPNVEEENKELLNFSADKRIIEPNPSAQEVFLDPVDEDGEVKEIITYDSGGYFLDPSFRPRVSKLFNMLTFPWKIPLTLNKLSKLSAGELISYSFSGYVELGGDIGFSLIPGTVGENLFNNIVGFRTFLKGTFKITVLKENDRYVRVKLSRIRESGIGAAFGGDSSKVEVFEGFLLFKGTDFEMDNVLKANLSLIPFKFNLQQNWAKSFDVGFRYDLYYPEAQMAYKKAVFGNFQLSSEYQGRQDESGDATPVERIFKRKAETTTRLKDQSLRVLVYQNNRGRLSKSVSAIIELPDGEKEVFKEATELSKGHKTFWGHFEKMQFNFTVAFDKTSFLEGKDNAIQLIAEANIEDSHTNGKEMLQYIHMVKKAIGKDEILPELPIYTPSAGPGSNNYVNVGRLAKYRHSNFYFGYNITQAQLEKFVSISESRMWDIMEKAFGVKEGVWSTPIKRSWYRTKNIWASIANLPLFLVNASIRQGGDLEAAKRFVKWWKKLKDKMPLDVYGKFKADAESIKNIQYFARMFKNRNFGYQYLRALFLALEEEEIDYFVTATNLSFGRIQQRGRVTTNPEYLMNLTDENIGFERLAGGLKSNPELWVKNLQSKVQDSQKVELSFETNQKPKIIYFKVFKTNRLQKYQIVSELIYKNTSRFDEGENKLVLDKKALDDLSFKLGEKLEENNYYTINISISNDGFSWSQVNSTRFLFKPNPEDQEL